MTSTAFALLPPDEPLLPRRAMWRHAERAPVRRVVTQRPKRICGYVASWKTKRATPYESMLERDAAMIFDTDPAVDRFYSQPLQVRYDLGEGPRRYTPDFELVLSGQTGRTFVEIKPDRPRPGEPDFVRLGREFEGAGHQLIVLREADIRAEPRLSNSRLCHAYAREPVSNEFRTHVHSVLSRSDKITLGELADALGCGRRSAMPRLLGLMCRGDLSFDALRALDDRTLVSLRVDGASCSP